MLSLNFIHYSVYCHILYTTFPTQLLPTPHEKVGVMQTHQQQQTFKKKHKKKLKFVCDTY